MSEHMGSNFTQENLVSHDSNKAREKIDFNRHGKAIGKRAPHFMHRVGENVKSHAPIKYTDWRLVPDHQKDEIWNGILKEFEVPIYIKRQLQSSMASVFRKHKNTLRKHYLDKCPNIEAQKLNIPLRTKKEDWEQFCENECEEKPKERRVKNVENKKRSRCGHTRGRKSAAMVEEELIQKQADPTIPISRTAVWIETHTRKDRSILPSAVELMEKIKENVKEVKNSENNSNIHPLSIDFDPLTQVLGKNPKGSLPGVGSHVSRRQYEDCLPGHIMLLNERAERKIIEKNFERLESKVDLCLNMCSKNISQTEAEAIIGSSPPPMMMNMNLTRKRHSLAEGDSITSARNETVEVARNEPNKVTHHEPYKVASNQPTEVARLCELLDWDGNCLAIAKEVVDPIHRGICHGYVLEHDEVKVSMVTRKMFAAKIYKADKNPESKKIGDVGLGDFLVWNKSFVKYMEP